MALAADSDNGFAAWLDLSNKHNKIFSAKSMADIHGLRILWSMLHLIQQYVNAANHQSQCKEIS
jgi:hypothetical protein